MDDLIDTSIEKQTQDGMKFTLEDFITLDEQIKYSTEESSLFNTVSDQSHLVKKKFLNLTDDKYAFH